MEDYKLIPYIITYLVKKINEETPTIQIGKTMIQKYLYFLDHSFRSETDLDYGLYHYGPYSRKTEFFLALAKNSGFITIDYIQGSGYRITPNNESQDEDQLEEKYKDKINELVARFANLNARQLSIVATADYLINVYKKDKNYLVNGIHEMKPYIKKNEIKKTLKMAQII